MKLKEDKDVQVVRYMGGKNIREMIKNEQYIEAFTHAQLGVERILWDKIVGIFKGEKARMVRTTIETSRKGRDERYTGTYELIKWAHFLRAINDSEFSDLKDFNDKRNDIMHGHGKWWHPEKYREALQKAIRFLEKHGF